jgi:hypothetical protein
MASATLTLGQSAYSLDPKNYPVKVALEGNKPKAAYDQEGSKYGYSSSSKFNTKGTSGPWTIESKASNKIISDLAVRTTEASSHTIVFKSAATKLDVDTTNFQSAKYSVDTADSLTFNNSVQNSKIVTGNADSKGLGSYQGKTDKLGDTVTFAKNVTNITLSTSAKADSVTFSGKVNGAYVDLGKDTDTVTFGSKEKLNGVSVNLGKDSVRDWVNFASKDSLNKTEIINFVDKTDRIKVEGKVYDTQAEVKKAFGDGIIFKNT